MKGCERLPDEPPTVPSSAPQVMFPHWLLNEVSAKGFHRSNSAEICLTTLGLTIFNILLQAIFNTI
jgi:hypothetical protein